MSARTDNIEKKAEELIAPIVADKGFELVDVEFVKEAGTWYLRAYIDKPGGITVDDCEVVSRAFEAELDRVDPIEESYILEVSSPGLDRPLRKDRDFERSVGRVIELRTYKPVDGEKMFTGELTAWDKDSVTVSIDGEDRQFGRKDISLIRLAIDF